MPFYCLLFSLSHVFWRPSYCPISNALFSEEQQWTISLPIGSKSGFILLFSALYTILWWAFLNPCTQTCTMSCLGHTNSVSFRKSPGRGIAGSIGILTGTAKGCSSVGFTSLHTQCRVLFFHIFANTWSVFTFCSIIRLSLTNAALHNY